MTFSFPDPADKRPLEGSKAPQYIPKSRETGDAGPDSRGKDAAAVTKNAPVAKPWAHFVAGG